MTLPIPAITGSTWLGAGNLPGYPGPHAPLLGFIIDRTIFPTRWAEYGFVLESLATDAWEGPVLDAGTGFNPEIHVLSCLLGALNIPTVALDANPATISLPEFQSVTRIIGNMCQLPQRDASMGLYVNVSCLEHMTDHDQVMAWAEAFRVLRPGGTAIVTADIEDPRALRDAASKVGFVTGPVYALAGPPLTPPVSWIRAMKPSAEVVA